MANKFLMKSLVCGFILSTSFLISGLCFSDDLSDLSGRYKDYNVILLTFDAMRPDHLGCYGYHKDTSPSVDVLAGQGLLFQNAFSQASNTAISVPSMYTSLYPYAHGVRYIFKDHLSAKATTLAQILKSHGYKTVWIGPTDDPHTGAMPGLLNGFELPNEDFASWIENNDHHKFFMTLHSYITHDYSFLVGGNNTKFTVQPSPLLETKRARLIALLQDWTEKNLGSFFESIDEGPGREWLQQNKDTFVKRFRSSIQTRPTDGIERKELWYLLTRGFYDSLNINDMPTILEMLDEAISQIDKNIVKALIDVLKKNGIFEKTIIIITADHGNEFMEHGRFGHSKRIYDESIRIPLIFYIPHLLKPDRIDGLAESVDIFPTVLDLLGIDIPSQAQGISLVSNKNAHVKEYIISESITEQVCLRSQKWKLIGKFLRTTDSFEMRELFDLENDPKEQVNIITKNPAVAEKLQAILLSKLRSLKKYRDIDRPFLPTVDEKKRDRIKKTGYW